MDKLSYEIVEMICNPLTDKEKLSCLMVNRGWYSAFIRHVYKIVSPVGRRKTYLFLESVIRYPRCREAGRYVKDLRLSGLTTVNIYGVHQKGKLELTDALKQCPNIEQLDITLKPCTALLLLSSELTEWKQLKDISFSVYGDNYGDEAMDIYFRYRSSLTAIRLSRFPKTVNTYTMSSLSAYVKAFPKLRYLTVDFNDTHFQSNAMLYTLLSLCPTLNNVAYTCDSLGTLSDTHSSTESSLNILTLTTNHLYPHDIENIRKSCPELGLLQITVVETIHDETQVFQTLIEMSSSTKIRVQIDNTFSIALSNNIWKTINASPDPIMKHAFFTPPGDKKDSITVLIYQHPVTKKKTALSTVAFRGENGFPYYSYLQHGECLDTLIMSTSEHRFLLSFNHINLLCPHLKQMRLYNSRVTRYTRCEHVNYAMKTIHLLHCAYLEDMFEEISAAYPSLKTLVLSESKFKRKFIGVKTYTIHLPRKNLKTVILDESSFAGVVVIKEANNVPIRSWHYQDKKVVVTEGKAIETLIKKWPVKWKLCLLKSTTIENVRKI
ncbi:hypothetical protein BDB01DRAFT_807605 [Pilobolus umbonatus]|nr:hypothetical protein BDB01DRAFT_807605 [Pilobolus umbonatus]